MRLPAGVSVEQALARLDADPRVEAVSPNRVYRTTALPDDTHFPLQWGLRNTGQTILGTAGTSGADIAAAGAWSAADGAGVTVAVVDTGVATDHPDLAPNLWTNPGEIAANGLDDDGNGYVDDVHGWDFYATDADPYDENGHGTHVAGIVAARSRDGYGIAGVASGARIMPLRALGADGSGVTSDIAEAFTYAAQNGAKVVNVSLGGSGLDPALEDAITSAPGVLFVVAAGNSATDNESSPVYPCNIPAANVLCVASTDQSDALSAFSNYGATSVDVGAPGSSIASTYLPSAASTSGAYSLADSPDGAYANGTDAWVQVAAPVDLTGLSSCALRYRLRASLLGGDQLLVERSLGDAWLSLEALTVNTGTSFTTRAPSLLADGQPAVSFRFRLVTDASGRHDGVFIDDVSVRCSNGTVWSSDLESGLAGTWVTGGTNDTWGRASVAGTWVYLNGTSMATPHVAGAAALIRSTVPSLSALRTKNVLMGSVDHTASLAGKTVSGGRIDAARAVVFAPDTTPPSASGISSLALYQRARSFRVAWWGEDDGAAGTRLYHDVQHQYGSYKTGTFGSLGGLRTKTLARSVSLSGSPGYTYCYRTRAHDGSLNTGSWSGRRCTVVPVNDRSMSVSSGWSRRTWSSAYLGTYSYTTTRGATIRLGSVRSKRLALVATRCSSCGVVDVYRGSTRIKRISLYSSKTAARQLIAIENRTSVSPASTITIRVVSSGRRVHVEGLAVSII